MGNEHSPDVEESRTAEVRELNLVDLAKVVWSARWLILVFVVLSAAVGGTYAFTATPWYRTDVVIVQAEKKELPSIGQLGGLASLAGINLEAGTDQTAMVVLKSRDFAREFIEKNKLLPLLRKRWDADAAPWKKADAERQPDIRDAVAYFDGRIRQVIETKRTGEVRVSMAWTDPELAASWANEFVRLLNEKLRLRALAESERNVAFLRAQLSETQIPVLQQSIGRALESELQKMMMARAGDEYAFKVIDKAFPPRFKESPKRGLIVLMGAFLGGLLGLTIAVVRSGWRRAGST